MLEITVKMLNKEYDIMVDENRNINDLIRLMKEKLDLQNYDFSNIVKLELEQKIINSNHTFKDLDIKTYEKLIFSERE